MHEATVAAAILKRALAAAETRAIEEKNADRSSVSDEGRFDKTQQFFDVVEIVVNVGEFRNVDPESLEFAFSALRKDSSATENTRLEIRNIPAIAACSLSSHEFHPEASNYFSCTTCGGGIGELLAGNELDIVNIMIELRLMETVA